jgi:murein DD-endopeptidase MepM/ murein hydrolase activator NlpD
VASTRRGRVSRLVTIVAMVSGLLIPEATATAPPSPAPTVSSISAKLDALADETRSLAQRYNVAQSEVRLAQMRADIATRSAADAQALYELARRELMHLTTAEYEQGSLASITALVTSPNQQRYLEAMEMLRLLANRRADLIAQVAAARDQAITARETAGALLAAAQTRRNLLGAQRVKITQKAAMYTRLRATLTLAQQAGTATSTSAAIVQWAATCAQQADAGIASTGSCGGLTGYVNPMSYGAWTPSRTDQGVDWNASRPNPVVAIGDGIITYSQSYGTGWPGGAFIAYGLTSGNHAGLYVYVAESLTDLVPVGTVVKAGQRIATAIPGGPETEWGYAAPPGTTPDPATPYDGAPDGTQTSGGKAFARFLIELGAKPLQPPGPGPDRP